MVRNESTTKLLLVTALQLSLVQEAVSFISPSNTHIIPACPCKRSQTVVQRRERKIRSAVSIYEDEDGKNNNGDASMLKEKIKSGAAYIDSALTDTISLMDTEDDTDAESLVKVRKEKSVLDKSSGKASLIYDVVLPITESMTVSADGSYIDGVVENKLGISLRQIEPKDAFREQVQISEQSLALDGLKYLSFEESDVLNKNMGSSYDEEGTAGSVQILDEGAIGSTYDGKAGLIVSSVVRGSLAWEAGVRAGDLLMATSATIGDKLWPKSTLDGVRSALSSRKIMSSTMRFQFQRANTKAATSEIVQEFELVLGKPLGINVKDDNEGYVVITGFTYEASNFVTESLRQGDRVVAVESSFGKKMWPVSSVEGLVSATTTRLPSQSVKLQFERVLEESELKQIEESSAVKSRSRTAVPRTNEASLLSRCRDVLKRYNAVYDPSSDKNGALPALVADKVLDSLGSASVPMDSKILSLVMNSYISCDQLSDAIKVFEDAVGLSADGSGKAVRLELDNDKKIIPAGLSALNLYTATDLIRAQAKLGNWGAARRILGALEGDENLIDGIRASAWPIEFKLDTTCYNTVLTAMTNAGKLDVAGELFQEMCEPVLFSTVRPKKNAVSFNIMIAAYARSGNRDEAFRIFNEMNEAGLKPDKYTITSLVKAVVNDGDFDTAKNFLRDMKRAGIEADVTSYNTVIRALCDKLMWFEAKELVADMESRGINANGKTYGLLMNALLKSKKPGPCLTLFEAACADRKTAALTENIKLYTTAITAAAMLGDVDRALEYYSRMSFAGIKPNIKTLTSLMGACLSGNNPDYALGIFKKIENPDGYSRSLAVRGYCNIGNHEQALDFINEAHYMSLMSGKQIMSSYNYVIGSCLKMKRYDIAIQAITNLLDQNYIPAKRTFRVMIENLELKRPYTPTTQKTGVNDQVNDVKKFDFMISVFDGLDRRRLSCDSYFYSSVLREGRRIGGLRRRVASLMVKSRIENSDKQYQSRIIEDVATQIDHLSWMEILTHYSVHRENLDQVALLSPVRVMINEKEIRQIIQAEQGILPKSLRSRKRKASKKYK